jgi:hypothetical protein
VTLHLHAGEATGQLRGQVEHDPRAALARRESGRLPRERRLIVADREQRRVRLARRRRAHHRQSRAVGVRLARLQQQGHVGPARHDERHPTETLQFFEQNGQFIRAFGLVDAVADPDHRSRRPTIGVGRTEKRPDRRATIGRPRLGPQHPHDLARFRRRELGRRIGEVVLGGGRGR